MINAEFWERGKDMRSWAMPLVGPTTYRLALLKSRDGRARPPERSLLSAPYRASARFTPTTVTVPLLVSRLDLESTLDKYSDLEIRNH